MTKLVYLDKLQSQFIRINKPGDAVDRDSDAFASALGMEVMMKDFELGAVQERFADIVWDNEPIASGDLAKVCEKELNWKRPTTYTVLRKLCEKGLLRNKEGIVTTLVSREEFYAAKSRQIIEDSYKGSLPAFVAAFISQKEISAKEADEIQKMIDAFRKEG